MFVRCVLTISAPCTEMGIPLPVDTAPVLMMFSIDVRAAAAVLVTSARGMEILAILPVSELNVSTARFDMVIDFHLLIFGIGELPRV